METNSIDARGARIALRMYIKWAWVPVIALVGGFFLGSSMSSSETVVGESELIVGLTDEVRWPFFDAVLVRQQGLIEDFDLAASTSEATGIEAISVAVQSENTQNSTLTILATVEGSAAEAELFANELGAQLVQANIDAQAASYVEEAEALQAQLDEQAALSLGFETEIADLTAEWVDIQDQIVVAEPEDIAELRGQAIVADRARRVAERRLDGLIASDTSLSNQLAQAERDAGRTASPVEISRGAVAVQGSSTDLGPVLAILNFLLALLAVPFLERGLGRVNGLDQLAVVYPSAKLIDARRGHAGAVQPVDVVALTVKSLASVRGPSGGPGSSVVVAEAATSIVTDPIVAAIKDDGSAVSLVDLETPQGLHDAIEADHMVLVVPGRSIRVGQAKELANDLTLLDATPEVIVLGKKRSRRNMRKLNDRMLPAAGTSAADRQSETSKKALGSDGGRPELAEAEPVLFDGRADDRDEIDPAARTSAPAPRRNRRMVSANEPSLRRGSVEEPPNDASLRTLLNSDGDESADQSTGERTDGKVDAEKNRGTKTGAGNKASTDKPSTDKASTDKTEAGPKAGSRSRERREMSAGASSVAKNAQSARERRNRDRVEAQKAEPTSEQPKPEVKQPAGRSNGVSSATSSASESSQTKSQGESKTGSASTRGGAAKSESASKRAASKSESASKGKQPSKTSSAINTPTSKPSAKQPTRPRLSAKPADSKGDSSKKSVSSGAEKRGASSAATSPNGSAKKRTSDDPTGSDDAPVSDASSSSKTQADEGAKPRAPRRTSKASGKKPAARLT